MSLELNNNTLCTLNFFSLSLSLSLYYTCNWEFPQKSQITYTRCSRMKAKVLNCYNLGLIITKYLISFMCIAVVMQIFMNVSYCSRLRIYFNTLMNQHNQSPLLSKLFKIKVRVNYS